MTVLVLENDRLYRQTAELFVQSARDAIEARGRFAVALSGGRTPRPAYSLLAREFAQAIPWDRVHIFFSDERCVPPDHPDSNFRTANEALLSKIAIPRGNIHRMKGEAEPEAAALDYAREIKDFFKLDQGEFPRFDLILLGVGEDAHTASIFPGSEVITMTSGLVAAPYVPKLKAHRLTLTPPVLLHARRVMLLATGEEKAEALKQALEGPYEPDRYPAQILREAEGEVTWLVNPAALKAGSARALP